MIDLLVALKYIYIDASNFILKIVTLNQYF